MLNKNSKIFLAGHNGLVGSSTLSELKKNGFKNIITVNRKQLDLRDYYKVEKFFKKKKIEGIIIAAARAGGILANNSFQKDFFLLPHTALCPFYVLCLCMCVWAYVFLHFRSVFL